jgi:hypothetical protein
MLQYRRLSQEMLMDKFVSFVQKALREWTGES